MREIKDACGYNSRNSDAGCVEGGRQPAGFATTAVTFTTLEKE